MSWHADSPLLRAADATTAEQQLADRYGPQAAELISALIREGDVVTPEEQDYVAAMLEGGFTPALATALLDFNRDILDLREQVAALRQ